MITTSWRHDPLLEAQLPMVELLSRVLGRHKPRGFTWLTPTLAVAGAGAARDPRRLARAGICAVVDLQAETVDQTSRFDTDGIRYLKVPVRDFAAPEAAQLEETTDWILDQMQDEGPVLIHCRMGLGRSVTFAIATMLQMGYSLPDAYNHVRRQHPALALSEAQLAALRTFADRARR